MTIEEAGRRLNEELRTCLTAGCVGIGDCELFVYLERKLVPYYLKQIAEKGWEGFPVTVKHVGKPSPLQGAGP